VEDIIIFGSSLFNHNENLIRVFQRLRKYNLKLNPAKYNFLRPEVVYLGHLITPEGICTDPESKDADDVRRFVALCNYYRQFINNFAEIAKPLLV